MASYESVIGTLEAELTTVADVFGGLAPDQWQRPTLLVPVDPELPRWTVFELAGHFDIAIGLTRMLIAGREDAQPARDRTSFFINRARRPARSYTRTPTPWSRARRPPTCPMY